MFDFFSPRIFFPVSALAFLLAGIIGAAFFPRFAIPPLAVLLQLAGIFLFFAGTFFSGGIKKFFGSPWVALSVFSAFFAYFSYLNWRGYFYPSLLVPLLLYCLWKYGDSLSLPLMGAGAALFVFNLHSGGIPLLDPSLRDGGYAPALVFSIMFFLLGFGLRIQSAGGSGIFFLSLLGAGLLSLSGYRGPVFILFIASVACMYHRRLIGLKKSALFFAILLVFVALMGWVAAKPAMNPAELLLHRAAYTNWIGGSILSKAPLSGVMGGKMWLEAHPRFYIGEMFAGKQRSITGGFFGSLWFDSGIAGLAAGSFVAGAVMQAIYERRKVFPAAYWLAIAYLALSVEGGLDAVYLAVFLAALFFVSGAVKAHGGKTLY